MIERVPEVGLRAIGGEIAIRVNGSTYVRFRPRDDGARGASRRSSLLAAKHCLCPRQSPESNAIGGISGKRRTQRRNRRFEIAKLIKRPAEQVMRLWKLFIVGLDDFFARLYHAVQIAIIVKRVSEVQMSLGEHGLLFDCLPQFLD